MTKFAFALLLALPLAAQDAKPFLGRWDITVTPTTGAPFPQWLEVEEKDGKIEGRFQPRGGAWQADGTILFGGKEYAKFDRDKIVDHILGAEAEAYARKIGLRLQARDHTSDDGAGARRVDIVSPEVAICAAVQWSVWRKDVMQ